MTPTTRLATLLLLLAVPLLSCSDEEDPPPRSTTTTTLSPEAEVEAAYLAYWDMVQRVTESPDPDDPEIADRAVDPARTELTDSVEAFHEAGQVVEIGPEYAHAVTDVVVDGNTAQLRDCAVDDAALVDGTSGEVIRAATVTSSLQVTLVLRERRWLVSDINRLRNWEGVAPCAE
jgi:hypothetical protein